ncbi:class I SAM-dependent methyltransferase [Pseudoroseicyclus sp. H15]
MTGMNEDQRAFWNDAPGRNWATHQTSLDAMHVEAADAVLAAASPAPGERALDIGCGAGETTARVARAVGPEGRALGLDISHPLAALARARLAGLPQAEVEIGDAQVWNGESGFDLAISRFGVMFFDEPAEAFANIRARLAPQGRIAFACWAGVEHNPWFSLPGELAAARFGTPPASPPPHAPGPMALKDTARTLGLFAEAGFRDATATPRDILLHQPSADEAARLARSIGPIPRQVRDKGGSDADIDALCDALAEALAQYETAEGLRIPARIILYTARNA